MRIAIRTGTLYDGSADPPRANVTLLIEDGRVSRIAGDGETIDAECTYEAACVVPGLINAHAHLEMNGEPDTQTAYLIRTPTERTLDAALERNAATIRS